MDTYQEKISLIQEMISFALIDGQLHDREYDFIEMVAMELELEKKDLLKLFEKKIEKAIIKDEFNRVSQFYRLALLMHIDGVLHDKERVKLNEIGINMGLNPYAMKRVLQKMNESTSKMIDATVLVSLFTEQHN